MHNDKYWKLSKHKSLELEFDWFEPDREWGMFGFSISLRRKGDHAGILVYLELFEKIFFSIEFYDSRHWDDDNDTFM